MKKLRFILPLFALCVLFLTGCKKEEIFKTFTQPYWHEEFNAEYTATMTAVVTLPQEIGTYIQDGDELAAFINGECRGVAKNIDGLNYIMIKGMPDENEMVTFKYYSARNMFMYQCVNCTAFENDGIYGTADSPIVLPLVVINE